MMKNENIFGTKFKTEKSVNFDQAYRGLIGCDLWRMASKGSGLMEYFKKSKVNRSGFLFY